MPADHIGDFLSDVPSNIRVPSSRPTIPSDIPSSSTSVLPPPVESILEPVFVLIDPFVTLMGQMSVHIEQLTGMMAKITQLRAASERHTTEFTTIRGMIAYLQRGIR